MADISFDKNKFDGRKINKEAGEKVNKQLCGDDDLTENR